MPIKNKKSKNRTLSLVLITLVIILAVGGYLIFHKSPTPKISVNSAAKTTSNLPTAQSTYSAGAARNSSSGTAAQGGAKDNSGVITPPGSSSSGSGQPTSSTSGLITLENPTSNEKVASGTEIYGTAQVNTVQFQLVDNGVGVIAQGSLTVVNSKFSGNLEFGGSYTDNGILNVYSQNTPTSPEVNLVSIPVEF